MKRLQLIAILSACGFLLFKAIEAKAHVELHFDSIEWKAIQEKQQEAKEELQTFHDNFEDDGSDAYRELEANIKSGDGKIG